MKGGIFWKKLVHASVCPSLLSLLVTARTFCTIFCSKHIYRRKQVFIYCVCTEIFLRILFIYVSRPNVSALLKWGFYR